MADFKTASRRTGHSKIDTAVRELAEAVLRGQFAEGTFLPSESELGSQLDVSRSVIRETMRRLASTGLVETRHGIGTYVNPSSLWNLFDPLLLRACIATGQLPALSRELVELRSTVEIESARLAAQRSTPGNRQSLQQWLNRMDASLDDPATFAEADLAYHTVIIEATENRFLTQIMKFLADPIGEARRITAEIGGYAGRSQAQHWHQAIFTAIQAQDPDAAGQAMRRHMEQLEADIAEALVTLEAQTE